MKKWIFTLMWIFSFGNVYAKFVNWNSAKIIWLKPLTHCDFDHPTGEYISYRIKDGLSVVQPMIPAKPLV